VSQAEYWGCVGVCMRGGGARGEEQGGGAPGRGTRQGWARLDVGVLKNQAHGHVQRILCHQYVFNTSCP
jgi:hypothetical protein